MRRTGSVSKSVASSPAACVPDGTVRSVVDELTSILVRGGTQHRRDTARDIVGALLHVSLYWSVLAGDVVLPPQVVEAARLAAQRVAAGAPVAYAVGTAQFRSLTLTVDERVLIPRPETEVLVGEILTRFR